MRDSRPLPGDWPEAMAEVMDCRYDIRVGRALAFGLASERRFRISYSYQVGDGLHTGECFSRTARLKGSLFPIHYNPDLPHLSHSGGEARQRVPLLVIGIAGSVALSLLWLLVLRGC